MILIPDWRSLWEGIGAWHKRVLSSSTLSAMNCKRGEILEKKCADHQYNSYG